MAMYALQNLIDIVRGMSAINYQSLNAAKCSTMCVVLSRKAAAGYPHHSPYINSYLIPWVHSVIILGVFFTKGLDWRQYVKSGLTTMLCKFLHKIGSLLNTRSRARICTSYVKPHTEYCLPVMGTLWQRTGVS